MSWFHWISFGGKARKRNEQRDARYVKELGRVPSRFSKELTLAAWQRADPCGRPAWPPGGAEAAGGTAHASPHRCVAPRNPRLPGFNSPVWVYNQQASQPQSVLFSPQPRKNYLQTWGSQPSQPPSTSSSSTSPPSALPSPPDPLSPPSPPAPRPRVLVLRWVTPRVILSPGVIHLNNRMTINGSHITPIFTNFHNYHPFMLSLKFFLLPKSMWLDKFSEWHYSTHWVNRLHMSLANLHLFSENL